jgi:hypothetical protein
MCSSNPISLRRGILCIGLVLLGSGVLPGRAQVFTLDTNQSSITISGTVIGGAINSQGSGSLTTSFGGTIQIAVVTNTLQFIGQSRIVAETNGSWQPKADGTAGSEPADFGGQASVAGLASGVAALRDIQLDAISPAVNLTSGKFDSSSLTFLFPSNSPSTFAYNVSGLLPKHGSVVLTGYATNKVTALGSLATVGNQQVLTIPVDATFLLQLISPNDTVIRLQGQLVAAQNTQTPLRVNSLAIQNQSILLQWQGQPGDQFQIQSSTDLRAWMTNATIVTPPSGVYTWTGGVTGPVRFFRLAK